MLTLADLANLRATAAAALPDLCTITRPAQTVDDTGGITEASTTVASNVACRVTRSQPRQVQLGGKEPILADWVVTLPYGTDVLGGDVLTVGTQVLKVVGLLTGSWRTAERALCTG